MISILACVVSNKTHPGGSEVLFQGVLTALKIQWLLKIWNKSRGSDSFQSPSRSGGSDFARGDPFQPPRVGASLCRISFCNDFRFSNMVYYDELTWYQVDLGDFERFRAILGPNTIWSRPIYKGKWIFNSRVLGTFEKIAKIKILTWLVGFEMVSRLISV